MRERSIVKMILLSIVTLGIYSIYWSVSTKNEMNRLGANVPTAWLLIVPIVSIYWLWKYSQAVEQITGNKVSAPLAFVVEWLLGFIGDIIIQTEFNKLAHASAGGGSQVPGASPTYGGPVDAGPLPDNSFGGPVTSTPSAAPAPAPVAPAGPTSFGPPAAPQGPVDVAPAPGAGPSEPQPPVQTPPQV